MTHPYTVTRTGGTAHAEAKVGDLRIKAERAYRYSHLSLFRGGEFEPAFAVERESVGGFGGLVASVVAGTLRPEALLAILLHMLPPNAQVAPSIRAALDPAKPARTKRRKGAA